MSSNYPDDIRNWDGHPASPFYQDPEEGLGDMDEEELELEIRLLKGYLDEAPRGKLHALRTRLNAAQLYLEEIEDDR